jgi:hypothetical protein
VALFIDEGLKTLCARNRTLFGSCRGSADDAYLGGMDRPVAVLLQRAFFGAFGATPTAARALSLVAALATLATLAVALPPPLRLTAVLLLASDPLFATFSRSSLIEVPWLAFAALGVFGIRPEPARAAPAILAMAAAFLVKGTALVVLPALVAAAWLRGGGASRRFGRMGAAATVAAGAAAAILLGVFGRAQLLPALVAGMRNASDVPEAAPRALLELLRENPVLYCLAAVGAAGLFSDRGRPPPATTVVGRIALVWIGAGLVGATMAGLSIPPPRYLVHLAVPLAVLGAIGSSFLTLSARFSGSTAAIVLAVVCGSWMAGVDATGWRSTAELSEARAVFRDLAERFPAARASGLWAPTLALGSGVPVVVTCGGCRFPPPAGAAENTIAVERALSSEGSAPLLLVAAEPTGEAAWWRRVLDERGLSPVAAAAVRVSGQRISLSIVETGGDRTGSARPASSSFHLTSRRPGT